MICDILYFYSISSRWRTSRDWEIYQIWMFWKAQISSGKSCEFLNLHQKFTHFLKFPIPRIPESCINTHLFLTIRNSINNITISRHCWQLEIFSTEMFESWIGLENLKTALIYIGGTLRGNCCLSLSFVICGEILTSVVFIPPTT